MFFVDDWGGKRQPGVEEDGSVKMTPTAVLA